MCLGTRHLLVRHGADIPDVSQAQAAVIGRALCQLDAIPHR